MSEPSTIHIKAQGTTETEFKDVSFRASVTTMGKTGPDAKKEAKPRIDQIAKVITEFATRAGIEADRVRTTFAVDVVKDYQTQKFKGYQAVYTVAFKAKNVREAIALHDALTSIEGVESPTPSFNVDNSPEALARAFENAASKANVTFRNECKALGFEPEQFRILRWNFIPDHRLGAKFMAFSDTGAASESHIDVSPGRALLETTYNFEFQRVG